MSLTQAVSFNLANSPVLPSRFGSHTEECWEYSRDALQRNVACWFPKTAILSKRPEPLAVHVNGSSSFTAIQPFDQLFALHTIGEAEGPRPDSSCPVAPSWIGNERHRAGAPEKGI